MPSIDVLYSKNLFELRNLMRGIGFSFIIIHYKKYNYKINFIIFFQIKGNVWFYRSHLTLNFKTMLLNPVCNKCLKIHLNGFSLSSYLNSTKLLKIYWSKKQTRLTKPTTFFHLSKQFYDHQNTSISWHVFPHKMILISKLFTLNTLWISRNLVRKINSYIYKW